MGFNRGDPNLFRAEHLDKSVSIAWGVFTLILFQFGHRFVGTRFLAYAYVDFVCDFVIVTFILRKVVNLATQLERVL